MSFYAANVNMTSNYYETSPTFKSGTVKIEKNGDNYIITFDCIGENNDKIKGVYQGTLTYLDYHEE